MFGVAIGQDVIYFLVIASMALLFMIGKKMFG